MAGQRRAASFAACAVLLLLGLAATARAIDDGACIIEIEVKGDLGVQGYIVYSETYEDDNGDAKKAAVKVPVRNVGSKGTISGVIPVVFPSGTTCQFSSMATNKNDPGYPALVAALAGAKIGTDKEPRFKLRTTTFVGSFESGNPDSEAETNSYIIADYTMTNITMDFDLLSTGAALRPGSSKTFKTAVAFAGGFVDADVSFQQGTYTSGFLLPLKLKAVATVAKSTACKVGLKDGAFALSCANLALTLDTITDGGEDDESQVTAKLILKGGTLAGTGLLSAVKPFNATRDQGGDGDYDSYTYDEDYQ